MTMLKSDKIDPKYAYEASGLFMDTEEAYWAGMAWYQKMIDLANTLEQARKERDEAKVNTDAE